jgi:hypothetical protein
MVEYVPATKKEIWILFPYLCISNSGASAHKIPKTEMLDSQVTDLVEDISALISQDDIVHLPMASIENSFIVSVCVYVRCYLIDVMIAYKKLAFLFKLRRIDVDFDKCLKQVKRYRRPLNVIFCGDRNSSICFEEPIVHELKSLPKYSVVYHGGCKGIDLYVDELVRRETFARAAGINTVSIPAEWAIYGNAAGPIRNRSLLSYEIDMVIAFHPDIEQSKGTKNMMLLAHQQGIPVYIHDLKRKERFEGDFSVL